MPLLLSALWRNQQQGKTLKPSEVRAVLLAAGATRWDDFRNVLMDLGLMRRTEDDGFVLVRDLSHLTVAELLDMLPWSINRALRVGDDYYHAWESELASRCELARNGLNTPLSISLEELFEMDGAASEYILDAGSALQEDDGRV